MPKCIRGPTWSITVSSKTNSTGLVVNHLCTKRHARNALEPTKEDHILNNEAGKGAYIKSFPAMRSHYSRSKNKRTRYPSPLLSVAEMHRLYVEKYGGGVKKTVVKYHYYNKVFNENFNLSFGYPKTDTCGTSEEFMVKLSALPDGSQEKLATQEMHEDHLRSAEKFHSGLRFDTEMAEQNSDIRIVTFDFQQNLPLPHLPLGDLFYMQ